MNKITHELLVTLGFIEIQTASSFMPTYVYEYSEPYQIILKPLSPRKRKPATIVYVDGCAYSMVDTGTGKTLMFDQLLKEVFTVGQLIGRGEVFDEINKMRNN